MIISRSARRLIHHATLKLVAILLFAQCTTSVMQAKNNCPWINEATASGILGGDAIGEYTEASSSQPASCEFIDKETTAVRTLHITVIVAPDFKSSFASAKSMCGSDAAPIQAIGNEAIMCSYDDRKGFLGERFVGRVRDQVFTITITSSIKSDPVLTRAVLKAKIYTAAEQVSGNLF